MISRRSGSGRERPARSRTSISTSRVVASLLGRHLTGARHALRGGARRAIVAGFVVVFGGVMLAEYVVFRRGLLALMDLRPAGPALTLYFVEGLMALVLVIGLISFVASGVWTYYRARDTRLLLAAPVPVAVIYGVRSIETWMLTSWALGVVGVPALAALGVAYDRGASFYASGAVLLALFSILTGAGGALLTTVAGSALGRAPSRLVTALAIIVLAVAFAVTVGRNVVPSTSDFYTIFEPGIMNGKPASIKFIEAKFALWPSHPFAAALYVAATGGRAGSAATRIALWLLPLGALVAAATAGRRLYGRTLPAIAESFTLGPSRRHRRRARRFPRWLSGPVGALIERDLVIILRSPHEWSRAAFLGVLLLLYTSFVFVAPLREAGRRPEAAARLVLLNLLASGYFLTAFGLRFAFPATSREGRAAWLFFSSPVRPFRVVLAKLALYAGLVAVVVMPIAMAGMLRLVRDPALTAALAGLLLMIVVTTTAVLLAFGTAWPDFREPNPEALSTTGGGLAATVVCLVYVAFIGWAGRGAALAGSAGHAPWLGIATVASAALAAAALALAHRRVRTLEAP